MTTNFITEKWQHMITINTNEYLKFLQWGGSLRDGA